MIEFGRGEIAWNYKVWEAITGAIGRTRSKIKFIRSQIKNPNFLGFNLDDTSFTHCSSFSLKVLDDRVSTFQELVVEF
jgi:hypothetical protein